MEGCGCGRKERGENRRGSIDCSELFLFYSIESVLFIFPEPLRLSSEREREREKRLLVPPRARAPTPQPTTFPFASGRKGLAASVSSARVDEKQAETAFKLPGSALP